MRDRIEFKFVGYIPDGKPRLAASVLHQTIEISEAFVAKLTELGLADVSEEPKRIKAMDRSKKPVEPVNTAPPAAAAEAKTVVDLAAEPHAGARGRRVGAA